MFPSCKWENSKVEKFSRNQGTAQLRREEDPENAPKCLIGPSYSLDNCPFICKVLYMKTSIQLRNKDIPFTVGSFSSKIGALQCCQTINQISNRLHIKVSSHFHHSHINQNVNCNMKYIFCYYDILSFITYAPCCNVFIKGAKFEILPK